MTSVEYDALVQDVAARTTERFPGVSQSLRETLVALDGISQRWSQSTNEPRVGGLILRPQWPTDVQEQLLTACNVSDWQRLQLQPQSPIYNAGLLFGNAGFAAALEAAPTAGIVVLGLEYLGPELANRWLVHLRVWWHSRPSQTGRPPHLLHIAERKTHAADCLAESGLLTVVSFPPMASRPQDLPYLLHAEASTRGGGLADFKPQALEVLVQYAWPSDWDEIRALANYLYDHVDKNTPVGFSGDDVRRGLEQAASTFGFQAPNKPFVTWQDLREIGSVCDTLTQPLLGKPFFEVGTFNGAPLDGPVPQLALSRLVSWGYKVLHDRGGAADNIEALLKLPLANHGSPKEIKETRDLIHSWRTLEQHSVERDDRGMRMRRRVEEWCEKACGSRVPNDAHWERCITCLMFELKRALCLLTERLNALCKSPEPAILIAQWRDRLEMSWPKHKYDKLLDQVLQNLGRTELLANAIAKDLIEAMQHQLTFYSPSSDRDRLMRAWLEGEIQRRFPRPPLISDDLVRLGVSPEKMDYWLRRCNRLFSEEGKDRDELLDLVTKEVQLGMNRK
jgi:hypothetical protein